MAALRRGSLIEIAGIGIIGLAGIGTTRAGRIQFTRIRRFKLLNPTRLEVQRVGIEEWIRLKRFATSNPLLTFFPLPAVQLPMAK